MSMPSLNKTWCVRTNVIVSDTTTAGNTSDSLLWILKEHLTNNVSTGKFAGTRHANSVWTVVSSCDGVSTAASDLWSPSTFNLAKFVHATAGTNHSWMVLRNAALGIDLRIDCNAASQTQFEFRAGLSGCFTGGTVTDAPSIVAGCYTFSVWYIKFISTYTLNKNMYTHFICDQEGRFFFLVSSPGSGFFVASFGFTRTIASHPSDTNNVFAMGFNSSETFPGNFARNRLTYAFWGIRGFPIAAGSIVVATTSADDGTQIMGGTNLFAAGGNLLSETNRKTKDELSRMSYFSPITVYSYRGFDAFCRRGMIPDVYQVVGINPGKIYPSMASPQFIVCGDYLIPWVGEAPLL